MNSIRCGSCSLVNFAAAEACKRCGAPLGVAGGNEWEQHEHSYSQPADSAFNSQPYDPYKSHYGSSAKASKSRGRGGLVVVVAIIVLLAIVGIPYILKHKKTSISNIVWSDYKAPDGSFSVSFPSAPKVMNTSQVTPAGNIQIHVLQAEANKDGGCMMLYGDFPTAIQSLPLNLLAEKMVQQLSNGDKVFTVSSWRNITIGRYEGIELDLQSSSSSTLSANGAARVYWVPPRLYVVLAAGSDSMDVDALKTKYFDSFKLLK